LDRPPRRVRRFTRSWSNESPTLFALGTPRTILVTVSGCGARLVLPGHVPENNAVLPSENKLFARAADGGGAPRRRTTGRAENRLSTFLQGSARTAAHRDRRMPCSPRSEPECRPAPLVSKVGRLRVSGGVWRTLPRVPCQLPLRRRGPRSRDGPRGPHRTTSRSVLDDHHRVPRRVTAALGDQAFRCRAHCRPVVGSSSR